jgi:hypothetical protein
MWETYALCLQVRASQTMHVLVEVHHLESIELIADFLDLLLLAWLDGFNTFRAFLSCPPAFTVPLGTFPLWMFSILW